MFGVRASSIRPVFSIPSTITALTYGIAYSQTMNVTESYVSNLGDYSLTVSSGSLPAGITFSTSEKSFTLSGTPTSKSSYAFAIRASLLGTSYTVAYSGTPSVTKITASGGAIAFDYNGYRVHAFIASSNFVVSSGCDDVEVMLLSGGGGGRGDGNGGGGGGGGGKWVTTVSRVSGTHAVTIGAGGAAGSNGTASSAIGVFSPGGGGGGTVNSPGNVGGSGGGGGGFASGGIASSNGVGFTQTTGFNGGAGGFFNGGGGGGMGGTGNNGNANPNETGGYGGSGQTTPFVTGWQDPATSVGRGGGGGGGGGNNGGVALGGAGGGEGRGNGGSTGGVGQNAAATYGAGGGGGYYTGGQGSSGFVWIRYRL